LGGGDMLDFYGDVSISTADTTTLKILIIRSLSTENADMIMMYINNY
jgi:hypothetical protein